MNPNFVTFGDNTFRFQRIDKRTDGGHKKARSNIMSPKHFENSRDTNATAEFSPGKPADRMAASAKFISLVIAVEGKRNGTARIVRPYCRPQGTTSANAVYKFAPVFFSGFPRLIAVIHSGFHARLEIYGCP
jgi:hypothetical protein